jgi:hypothetical protein
MEKSGAMIYDPHIKTSQVFKTYEVYVKLKCKLLQVSDAANC